MEVEEWFFCDAQLHKDTMATAYMGFHYACCDLKWKLFQPSMFAMTYQNEEEKI